MDVGAFNEKKNMKIGNFVNDHYKRHLTCTFFEWTRIHLKNDRQYAAYLQLGSNKPNLEREKVGDHYNKKKKLSWKWIFIWM